MDKERCACAACLKPTARKPARGQTARCRAMGYEVFRLKWHDAWVVCTLPHESAIVSKTRSWRTSGFTYGFFTALFASFAEPCRRFCSVNFIFVDLTFL